MTQERCGVGMTCGRWLDHRGQHGGFRPIANRPESTQPSVSQLFALGVMSGSMDGPWIDYAAPFDALGLLSDREVQVLTKVAGGKTYNRIAFDLGLKEHTIRNHVSNIHAKLNVDSTIGIFVKLGWLRPPKLGNS